MNLILCLSSICMYFPSMYAASQNQTFISTMGSMIATCSFLHHFTNKNDSFFHKLDLVPTVYATTIIIAFGGCVAPEIITIINVNVIGNKADCSDRIAENCCCCCCCGCIVCATVAG